MDKVLLEKNAERTFVLKYIRKNDGHNNRHFPEKKIFST